MTSLPFMPLDVPRFLTDAKVAALPGEAKGVYLLLLCCMWNNEGWLSADERIMARTLSLDIRRWRSSLKPLIEPLLSRSAEPLLGDIYTQKRLTEVRGVALEAVQKNKARTARARAVNPNNTKARRRATVQQRAPATATVTEPVTVVPPATVTVSKVEVEEERALPIKKAESPFLPTGQGLGAPSGEAEEAASVASPSRQGGSLPPPSPALLRSKIVKGDRPNGTATEPAPERGRDRGDQDQVPEPAAAERADAPAVGLFGALEAAIRKAAKEEG